MIATRRGLFAAVVAAGIASFCGAAAADECPPQSPETTRILVPVLANRLDGVNGSVWTTELWMTNVTDCPVVHYFWPCQVSCCCDLVNTHSPQVTETLPFDRPRGFWFQMPADGALQFQARLRDESRNAFSAGTELPLVRESDFREDQINLIGIPRDPRFRTTVRLYALSSVTVLRVELVSVDGTVKATHNVPMEPASEEFAGGVPAYAQISMESGDPQEEPLRVRVTSLEPASRFWAFASLTNNDTSEVTIVGPSR